MSAVHLRYLMQLIYIKMQWSCINSRKKRSLETKKESASLRKSQGAKFDWIGTVKSEIFHAIGRAFNWSESATQIGTYLFIFDLNGHDLRLMIVNNTTDQTKAALSLEWDFWCVSVCVS